MNSKLQGYWKLLAIQNELQSFAHFAYPFRLFVIE